MYQLKKKSLTRLDMETFTDWFTVKCYNLEKLATVVDLGKLFFYALCNISSRLKTRWWQVRDWILGGSTRMYVNTLHAIPTCTSLARHCNMLNLDTFHIICHCHERQELNVTKREQLEKREFTNKNMLLWIRQILPILKKSSHFFMTVHKCQTATFKNK